MKIMSRQKDGMPKRKALVVEADQGTREICRAALECLGFSVDAMDSGVEAVATARKERPDVILFDVQLRDARGVQLLEWLKDNPALDTVPMIAISAFQESEEPVALGRRLAGFLRKPVSRAMLKSTVRSALGIAGAGI